MNCMGLFRNCRTINKTYIDKYRRKEKKTRSSKEQYLRMSCRVEGRKNNCKKWGENMKYVRLETKCSKKTLNIL